MTKKTSKEKNSNNENLTVLINSFDDLFHSLGMPDIPGNYLWALSRYKNTFNVSSIGLMSIDVATTDAYNNDNPSEKIETDYHLKNPENNIKIAVWLIRRILSSFTIYHPISLKIDWNNSRFIGLVTQAYICGESEKLGVGRAVSELEKRNVPIEHISAYQVSKIAQLLDFNQQLYKPAILNYINQINKEFFRKCNL